MLKMNRLVYNGNYKKKLPTKILIFYVLWIQGLYYNNIQCMIIREYSVITTMKELE